MLIIICLFTLVPYIANNMDPDQTAPLWAVLSGFILFAGMMKVGWSAFEYTHLNHFQDKKYWQDMTITFYNLNLFVTLLVE